MVYVGHEEGCIFMWELDTEDGYHCGMKGSSAFDILSLEGVSNRLWAGSRNVNRQGTSLFRYLYGSGLAPDALSAPAIVFYALPDRSW